MLLLLDCLRLVLVDDHWHHHWVLIGLSNAVLVGWFLVNDRDLLLGWLEFATNVHALVVRTILLARGLLETDVALFKFNIFLFDFIEEIIELLKDSFFLDLSVFLGVHRLVH